MRKFRFFFEVFQRIKKSLISENFKFFQKINNLFIKLSKRILPLRIFHEKGSSKIFKLFEFYSISDFTLHILLHL